MTTELILAGTAPESREGEPHALTPAQSILRKLVLDSVPSLHSKRNYAKALDDLFTFCASRPLSRALLMEWRAGMEGLSASTLNVRLSAVRKMVGEARRNGMLDTEEAANLTDVPNIRQKGTRLGNWLTREQAKELLAVPDRSTLKGKTRLRDPGAPGRLRSPAERVGRTRRGDHPAARGTLGTGRSGREGRTRPYRRHPHLGQAGNQRLDDRGRHRGGPAAAVGVEERKGERRDLERLGGLVGS